MAIELLLGTALAMTLGAGSSQRLLIQQDIPYAGTDDVRQTLDVYAPEGADGAPLLVFIHGGGLLFGDKSLVAHVGQRLAAAGIVTVAPNHRFSPAVSHPAHVEDAAAAVAWAVANGHHFGADPGRLVLAGHSSGGYLAGLLATDPRWLAAAGVARERISAVVPISGFFHVPRLAPERPQTVWGGNLRAGTTRPRRLTSMPMRRPCCCSSPMATTTPARRRTWTSPQRSRQPARRRRA